MTTFSQLVDAMILETRRPDMASEIQSYVNQTIRELHFRPDNNAAILYRSNLLELALTSNLDTGFTWTIPNMDTFQAISAVRFASVSNRDFCDGIYVDERTPGRGLVGRAMYWYRASNYVVFYGYGGVAGIIQIAYFEYPKRLKYYAAALRPATWDVETGWTYKAGITTDEDKEIARNLVTNWVLLRWTDLVMEGIRAKVYKRLSDDSRAKTSYSLYTQARMGIYTSETWVQGVY